MSQFSQLLVDDPIVHQALTRIAQRTIEVLTSKSDPAADEPAGQEAPAAPEWVPVGIRFDDDTQFYCLMRPEERDRLYKDYDEVTNSTGVPYAYRTSPDDVDRRLALRISDIHHLY